MPGFNLSAAVTVSAYTVVEADTLEEAIELSQERHPVIGGLQSGADENESWIIEDADGEATDITGEEG